MGTIGIILDLIYLLVTAFLAAVLYPLWINFVYKFHLGEEVRDEGPKTHVRKIGTPTMGGLVFVLSVSIVSFFLNRSRTQTLFPLFVATLAGLLGILEDFTKVYRRSGLPGFLEYHFQKVFKKENKTSSTNIFLKPWYLFKEFWRVVGSTSESGIQTYQKFIFQALLGGFVSYWTYVKLGWDYIWFPLAGNIQIGILYPIIIFFLFIAILNSVAFTDGLDGLAGGLSLIALITYWAISRVLGNNSLAGFCATFIGALLPFMYFNIYPARIFMGNVGSHVLGATLVVLSIVMHREVALIFICLPFIVDGVSSPLQQISVKLTGKRILRMAPLHHHFELKGWPETKVTLRFLIFGIVSSFIGMFIALL